MKLCFRRLKDYLNLDLDSYTPRNPVEELRVSALRDNFFKKLIDEVKPDADSKALQKFLDANNACGEWELRQESMLDEYLIGEFRNEIYRFWYKNGIDGLASSVFDFYRHGRTGPGSSIGAQGSDYYSKLFSSRLTVSSKYLYEVYRRYSSALPIMSHAEKAREADWGEPRVVEGNRLHFVPKTDVISRVICVEPSLNTFFQMGFKHILESRLRQIYSIDLSTQPDKNRELALQGSIDGSLATIDLSSASDSVGLRMLRSTFPKQWVDLMEQTRSPRCQLPDGRSIELHMVSSMGNAFTFPLETIIFRAILSVAARLHGLHIDRKNLAVFGDDLVCPTVIAGKVFRLLKLLGFTVNAEKTFVEGHFRESCGHDYLMGHDVRFVAVKSLTSMQDRYVAINLLNAWTAKYGIPTYNAVRYLLTSVVRNYVPAAESFDAGILVPYSFLARPRFDRNGSVKYRPFRARPVLLRINKDTLKISGFKSRKLSRNPAGLLESFLRGYIRDHTIPIRNDWVVYSAKRNVTPNWDYIPTDSTLGGVMNPFKLELVKRQWNSAVYLNIV